MKKINAFTLAEIMIVLCVIGILTAVLLPAARNIMPNEDVIKFKKAHNTLTSVVRELVTSDKYYKDGMLNEKAGGGVADASGYFCETIADMLNVKSKSCNNGSTSGSAYRACSSTSNFDDDCANKANIITLADNVEFYEINKDSKFTNSNLLATSNGFYTNCKVYCIDIDGSGAVAPFGYGVRIDGKITLGTRAQEWLNKSIQEKE